MIVGLLIADLFSIPINQQLAISNWQSAISNQQ